MHRAARLAAAKAAQRLDVCLAADNVHTACDGGVKGILDCRVQTALIRTKSLEQMEKCSFKSEFSSVRVQYSSAVRV